MNEEKTVIRTLYIFLLVALIGSVFIVISALMTANGAFTSLLLSGLVGLSACLILFWFLSIKEFRIPRIFLPTTIYLLATYLIFTGTTVGVRDDAVLLYSLLVALAGLMLGKRGVIIFGVLSVLTVDGAVLAEINGLLVNQIDSHTTTYATLVTVGVTYSLTFIMMYILVSFFTRSLAEMRDSQQELRQANLELNQIRASLEQKVLERTAIAEAARKEAESARKSAETQMWFTAGQAQLAEQMRGDLDVKTLANNIIRHMCLYTGAQTGVLFLVGDERLHLAGSYAYNWYPGAKTAIRFGEGLLGQAARDNVQILLSEIPADAPVITSSLGECLPRQVLIAPLEKDEQVVGVMELATLDEFTTTHQVFIGRCSESIAIAFRTAQSHERITSLLAGGQRQAAELQAQGLELRAANSELQTQAENKSAHQRKGKQP
jgi:hypothetical protein